MTLDDVLYYVIGWGLILMAGITIWAVITPGQALFVG